MKALRDALRLALANCRARLEERAAARINRTQGDSLQEHVDGLRDLAALNTEAIL